MGKVKCIKAAAPSATSIRCKLLVLTLTSLQNAHLVVYLPTHVFYSNHLPLFPYLSARVDAAHLSTQHQWQHICQKAQQVLFSFLEWLSLWCIFSSQCGALENLLDRFSRLSKIFITGLAELWRNFALAWLRVTETSFDNVHARLSFIRSWLVLLLAWPD